MNATGPTVTIATLGCKVNQAESDGYAQRFASAGFRMAAPGEPADVCVVNSCTVTNAGDRKSRQMALHMRRANPDALIAITGCYAAIAPERVERLMGADLVAGLEQKERLVELVGERLRERGLPLPQAADAEGLVRAIPRTRLTVKVQDGCNDFCSYCIVPLARGRARSIPPDDVLAQVRGAEAEGYGEVVLSGVNMTTYGRELGLDLGALVESLLGSTSIPRIRLSSIEPYGFDPAWLRLWQNKRLCRHLHLPLQSGCDATLRRMRRRYAAADYESLLGEIRRAQPGMAIWTDIIAGFPGETEEEFRESFAFAERMSFAGIHVFRYSPRSGTRAARMDGQVPDRQRKERAEQLLALSRAAERRFAAGVLDTDVEVLFESDGSGLTDTYVRVRAEGAVHRRFGMVHVIGRQVDGEGLKGVLMNG